ncbi:GH3 auxin-responsive promoter family protein [soil metagenome]
MTMLSTMASSVWLASSLPSWRRFRCALQDPWKGQERILRRLLAENSRSAYGRAYNFGSVRNYADFKERVPLVKFDDLAPWIQRVAQGESSVLTSEPVTNLIPTSGSTAGRKLIPFTAGLQREFNAAIGPWMLDLARQHPAITSGTAYWSISPSLPPTNKEAFAVPIGFEDDSGYLGGIRRRLVEATFAVPSLMRHAPNIETSRYLTLLCLLRSRALALISVWHPSFLALLLDALPAWWEELADDVRTGGCSRGVNLREDLRRAMTSKPQPARAKELLALDPTQPEKLWPGLKLVSCWGDGQASLAWADLKRRLPNTAIQQKGLLASEAFISIPFQGLHPLAVTSHFYEFSDAADRIHLGHELKTGETYSVIVTTGGGLWRYRLGDIVEVSGFLGATPSLRFLGREGNVSDLCGEKLSEAFVTQAISRACLPISDSPRFALLAPEHNAQGRWCYTLFVEGEAFPQLADLLDRELCENPHYAICRNLGQLGPVRCFQVIEDGYATYANTRMKRGLKLGEIKPQFLSAEPNWTKVFRGHYATTPV